MKCLICGKEFEQVDKDIAICKDCEETREELTHGKEED